MGGPGGGNGGGGGGFYSGKGGKGGGGAGGKAGGAAVGPAGGDATGGRQPGDELPAALKRKLKALEYPEMTSACLTGQAYCKIVLWLEEEKIRLYEKHDRRVLRDFSKAWYQHVADYAKELGIPAEGLNDRDFAVKLRVLNGLTNLAVHDIYRDKVEANELVLAPPPKAAKGGADKQRLGSLIPPLNRLMELFSLPSLPEDAQDADTVAALKCIHARICPSEHKDVGLPVNLDALPLGLQIADPEVRRAAAVLRLLHGLELQELQVNINQVINELQQLTADPKTDSSLGRLGR